MARPIEFNETVVKKLEEAFAYGSTIEEACFYAGITRQTYYNNVKEGSELFDRFKELKHRPVLKARKMIVDNLDKDVKNAQWYLEKKRKEEFGNNLDIKVDGEIPVRIVEVSKIDEPTDNKS